MTALYESLTLRHRPAPADLIYVMAGKMDRKDYGLELYRSGLSPRLLLGVGRFEVSKMHRVALPSAVVKELIELRDKTPADRRHFLVKLDAAGVSLENRLLRRWSTYGEILDLQVWLQSKNLRKVLIVSTDIHLRRVAFTCAKVFRDSPVEFLYCPVPTGSGSAEPRYVIKEVLKLVGYKVILSLPGFVSRRLMRLKD